MSTGFPVACPGCGARYLLPQPPQPAQTFRCQSCGQSFAAQGGQPTYGSAESTALPRWLIPAGIGIVVLAMAAMVGISIGKWIGRPTIAADGGAAAPGDGTAAPSPAGGLVSGVDSPFDDTPDALAEEFKEHAVALRDTLLAIQDERSRDAAIPKLREMATELNDLALRSGSLEPLSDAEFSAFRQRLGQPPDSESFDVQRGDQLRQRGILNEELSDAALKAGSALSLAGDALLEGLKSLPAGANEAESLEREKVEWSRAAARTLCRVSSGGDLDAAAAEVDRITAALRALAAKKEALTGVDVQTLQAKTKYLEADALAGRMIFAAADSAATRGPHERLAQAVADSRSASSQVDFARPGAAPGVAQAAPSGPGGPAFGPFGPGGPPGFGPSGPGFDPLSDFVRQFGADKVVTFASPRLDDGVRDALVRRLQALASTSNSSSVSNNDGTRIALNYEGDVEALGRRIDFAAVLTIDAATRTIELRVHADEL